MPLLLAAGPAAAQGDARGFMARARAVAAAMPAVPACIAPRADARGMVAESALPGMVEGAARGTTGGLGHRLLLVTEAEGTGPGTLRWAVQAARAEGGGWISFAPSLQGQVVRVAEPLRLPSDTTLDGGCSGVTLMAPGRANLVLLRDVSNVIVARLRLTKEPYEDLKAQGGDAIGISGRTDRVAVLHNSLARCGDGCVDIVRRDREESPLRVTVAFNHFADHNKVMLIGSLACYVDRTAAGCDRPLAHLGDVLRPSIHVTVQGNVFEGTSQRHPKVASNAAVHLVDNLILTGATTYADGRASAVYGAAAATGGLLAAEGNILLAEPGRSRLGIGPVSATREGDRAEAEADGAVLAARNTAIGPVRVVEAEPALAAAARTEVRMLDPAMDPLRRAACLLRIAGPEGASLAWPACGSPLAKASP